MAIRYAFVTLQRWLRLATICQANGTYEGDGIISEAIARVLRADSVNALRMSRRFWHDNRLIAS